MYSTARRTTLVDYNQRHSPSTISKSSLQLIHLRRIVSISLFAKNNHLPNRCRRMRTISGRHLSSHSSDSSSDYENPLSCDSTHIDSVLRPGNLLSKSVTWIGVATITSKVLGLLREIVIASAFGIGPVVTAFRYASVLPGFAASVLGGVNGPIHITMTTTLRLVAISVGGLLAALVLIYSESVIHIYAPGAFFQHLILGFPAHAKLQDLYFAFASHWSLWTSAEGLTTSRIAIQQLKIMTPCVIFAGPVGLGFGYMSAKGENVFPAISPTLSSLLLIASLFSILVPAIFNSGLAQIASFTDLCFASHFAGAAAGLSWHWFCHPFYCIGALLYSFPFPIFLWVLLCGCPNSHFIIDIVKISDAFLLVMAPLGLLSSIVILPLLPIFSGLIKVVLLPIISVMSSLTGPIIRVLFERYAFDSSASALVSSIFLFYSLGSPFLIVRELVVAVFYAFGDGLRPFLVSIGAIALNAILDWFFVHRLHIGVQGLALSTSLTAALSLITLIQLLRRKVEGLFPLHELISLGLLLCFCCVISSFITSFSYENISKVFLSEYITRLPRIQEVYCIVSAAALGIIGFFAPLVLLNSRCYIFLHTFIPDLPDQMHFD
uniref:Lipid II flippase MurJ n=1 Tax=Solanum lycopersicum TaxID=4081 RepID=A0A3Q7FBS2_SOLLC